MSTEPTVLVIDHTKWSRRTRRELARRMVEHSRRKDGIEIRVDCPHEPACDEAVARPMLDWLRRELNRLGVKTPWEAAL